MPRLGRTATLATLTIFALACSGCYHYVPVPLTEVERGGVGMGDHLRFFLRDGAPVDVTVTRIQLPLVLGHNPKNGRAEQVDLRDVYALEVRRVSAGKTVAHIVIVAVTAVLALTVIVLATKESCPFVYIDRGDGPELVGEAYAGAAFRSIQRGDLLPIPALPATGTARLQLANGAHETQYTDQAALLLVDHSPATRALSAHDGQIHLVGAPALPASVRDLAGADRRAAVLAAADGKLWQTDLEAPPGPGPPALRDGLVATFVAPAGDGPLVLELVGGNTFLLDVVFGRFFAAMGDRLDTYLARGNDPQAGARINGWRQREGVDLEVEVLDGSAWKRVAHVPTVGPAALRQVAVLLPASLGAGRTVTVRLSGGTAFWRIDQLALSRASGERPTVHRLAPVETRDSRRPATADPRALLAAVDGRYHVLAEKGDLLDLRFDLPALAPGQTRDGYFQSHGYYNVHRPASSTWNPGTLRALSRDPGALARFGIDLYRAYQQRLAAATRAAPP